MAENTNPYSLQQAPDEPDLSLSAYLNSRGLADNGWNRFWHSGSGFDDWKHQQTVAYNNAVNAVNFNNEQYYNWLETYPGQKAMLEEAGYNTNLLAPGSSGSAGYNPVAHANTPATGQGLNTAATNMFNSMQDILGQIMQFKQMNAQVAKTNADAAQAQSMTTKQQIENQFLEQFLTFRNNRSLNDWQRSEFDLSRLYTPVYGEILGNSAIYHDPTTGKDINIDSMFLNDPDYQNKVETANNLRSMIALRSAQIALTKEDTKIQKYYYENIQPQIFELATKNVEKATVEKEILDIEKSLKQFVDDNKTVDRIMGIVNTEIRAVGDAISSFLNVRGAAAGKSGYGYYPVPYTTPTW